MATATKPRPASAELATLQRARDKAHAKVREAATAIGDWDDETQAMRIRLTTHINAHPDEVEGAEKRVRAGTEAHKLQQEVKQRLAEPNPHQAAHDAAFPPYEAADLQLQKFKRERLSDRLAELEPDANRATERIREGWALVRDGCDEFREAINKVREVVIDTPGLGGQDYRHDPRPEAWRREAQGVLDAGIVTPGLTQLGEWKAAEAVRHG